jgi:hypothetical protein
VVNIAGSNTRSRFDSPSLTLGIRSGQALDFARDDRLWEEPEGSPESEKASTECVRGIPLLRKERARMGHPTFLENPKKMTS